MNDATARTAPTDTRIAGAGQSAAMPTVTGQPPPSDAAPPERVGDYLILRRLGEGGMGTVYLAEDVRLGRKAAVKVMRPELAAKPRERERFLREARAAAAVEHDHIVAIWGIGEAADGSPYLVMPFLQGETLADRLAREPVADARLVLKVAKDVADSLAAAHALGLIHRDIKPANVWLEGDPAARELAHQVRRCKVLDFGLARSAAADDAHLTDSGAILGTPAFMALEQARGEPVDGRSDLFSLGAILYRMAAGALPFPGTTPMAVLISLATVTPPPASARNPALPPGLSELIDR
ncbi:MAG: serine/threonine-protein kinase, partial [Gemmataceae bacterium]